MCVCVCVCVCVCLTLNSKFRDHSSRVCVCVCVCLTLNSKFRDHRSQWQKRHMEKGQRVMTIAFLSSLVTSLSFKDLVYGV